MSFGSSFDEATQPFPQSGLAALLFAAAADMPDHVLLGDDDGTLTSGEIARRLGLMAGQFHACGLVPGERILIVAGAQTGAIVALAAALHAGLEPALVPCGAGPVELAACARSAGAVALVGPSRYGSLDLGDIYLSTAAVVDTIRMVATQGPEPVDGALDLSARALAAMPPPVTPAQPPSETPVIATFQGPPAAPTLILHRQAALFADALSLVEQARVNPSKRIVSTLPPATQAGLVAGPFAALIGASHLTLHGPFHAARFLAAWDARPGSHLVAPVAIGQAFGNRALSAELVSLVLVSRFADASTFALPASLAVDRPMVDLYAFGEDTLLARRRTDGEAHPPARITDKSLGGGLGARLNRARADHPARASERTS